MKRLIGLFLQGLLILSIALSGCSQNEAVSKDSSTRSPDSLTSGTLTSGTQNTGAGTLDDGKEAEITNAPEDKVINVWSYSSELQKIIEKFKELHPDFGYTIKGSDLSNSEISMQTLLDRALAAGGPDAPDIYAVESAYAVKYTKGEASRYAAAYKDLGIDIDSMTKEASIAKYVTDIGTNPEGQIVGLGYQSTAGTFIYRRSIAKNVWGTDDPHVIKDIVGPGWDKFTKAAADLKAKGYVICSSADDIWQAEVQNVDQAWVVDGKLFIDPKREEFMDYAMMLRKNGYINSTKAWTDEWMNDMKSAGGNRIFGYFGPSWFIEYVLLPNCGGEKEGEGTYGDWAVCEPPIGFYWGGTWVLANKDTGERDGVAEILKWITLDTSETGLQYLWANDRFGNGVKDAVASSAVMKRSDGKIDFLGGQNLFDMCISAGENVNGGNATKYDKDISYYWLTQVHEYMDGNKSREQAIADFKKMVADKLDISVG